MGCLRCGIDGPGEEWRLAEHPGEGAAPADGQGWQELRSGNHPGGYSAKNRLRAGASLKWPLFWTSRSGRCSAPSGGTPGMGWMRCWGTTARSTATGLDDRGEAHLIALAFSLAPEGHDHWTPRALAGKAVELGLVESLFHGTVRLHLKKRPQAVSQAAVVHPESRRRRGICGGHGGRAGALRRALWPAEAGGLY